MSDLLQLETLQERNQLTPCKLASSLVEDRVVEKYPLSSCGIRGLLPISPRIPVTRPEMAPAVDILVKGAAFLSSDL